MGGHRERLHDVEIVAPTIEVGALDDGPVPFEPRPHQRVAADHLQVCHILWPEKFVVLQLARNEDAILLDRLVRPRILIRELSDFPSGRIGVDLARLDPLVSGPAGVAVARNPQGTPAPQRNVAISLRTGDALGNVPSSSTYTRV